MRATRIIFRIFAVLISLFIIGYVLVANSAPITINDTITMPGDAPLNLTPAKRVEKSDESTKLIEDLVYFDNKMQFKYDTAHVTIAFKNENLNQNVSLGFK